MFDVGIGNETIKKKNKFEAKEKCSVKQADWLVVEIYF